MAASKTFLPDWEVVSPALAAPVSGDGHAVDFDDLIDVCDLGDVGVMVAHLGGMCLFSSSL